jgi:hypothetical protein
MAIPITTRRDELSAVCDLGVALRGMATRQSRGGHMMYRNRQCA